MILCKLLQWKKISADQPGKSLISTFFNSDSNCMRKSRDFPFVRLGKSSSLSNRVATSTLIPYNGFKPLVEHLVYKYRVDKVSPFRFAWYFTLFFRSNQISPSP